MQERNCNEKNIPTIEPQESQQTRLQSQNGNQGRPCCSCPEKEKGKKEPEFLRQIIPCISV
jgi:hypothetical protein